MRAAVWGARSAVLRSRVAVTAITTPGRILLPGFWQLAYAGAMRENRLRTLINAGKPTFGTRVQSSWPTIIELVGRSQRFDYVEFLAEYAPYDLYALDN